LSLRVAFVGFRHGHVGAMYESARRLPYVDIVACVEDEPHAHGSCARELGVRLTHETFDQALADTDFDVLVNVDYYAKRASHVIKALQAGKHVFSDKPLCTRIEDLRAIAALARQKGLQVGIDLTMRYTRPFAALARIVQDGGIGELSSCMVIGLHDLAYGTRPMWYFEEGKHGGTLNDLMIHGVDLLRWTTGLEFTKVIAAEAWNRRVPQHPHFQDAAQVVYEMSNRAKYLGDCSYMAHPGGVTGGWRFYLWGTEGDAYADHADLRWGRAGEGPKDPPDGAGPPVADPFEDFVSALEHGTERWISTEECFRTQMAALAGQLAADTGQRDVEVPAI
jgi:predicted dehydrogenase